MSKRRTTQTLTPDELQDSVNKSAEHLRVLWISYSLFAIYLIITSLSVTHRHLFLELPLRLPVLNIDLGLQDFFIAAPILFIGMHLYLVFHLNVLSQQVVKYQDIIRTQTAEQERKSYLFDPFIFVQSWVGHAKGWRSKIGFFIITHGSLKVFPIFVLLLIMLSALPYHDEKLTHYHRFMVMVDFVVIVTFAVHWRKGLWHFTYLFIITVISFVGLSITLYGILIFQGEDLYKLREEGFYTEERKKLYEIIPFQNDEEYKIYKEEFHIKKEDLKNNIILPQQRNDIDTYYIKKFYTHKPESPFLKSLFFKTIFPILKLLKPYLQTSTKYLLEGEANYITGKPESLFSNRLILINEDFTDDKLLEELELREKNTSSESILQNIRYKMILRKRGRHFENAIFDYSNLPRTDFTGAYISNASFVKTNLEKSNFSCDNLPNNYRNLYNYRNIFQDKPSFLDYETYLNKTPQIKCFNISHKNVNFTEANLKKSSFSNMLLQGSNFLFAQLQDANLREAQLQGADLFLANLQGADLSEAGLQGAKLTVAQLQDADLYSAQLQGANLSRAELQGANLYSAQLQGANLYSAQLQGANLYSAQLQGSDLYSAQLQGADLACTNLDYTNLDNTNIRNSYFSCNSFKDHNRQKNTFSFLSKDTEKSFYDGQKTAFLQNIIFKYDEQKTVFLPIKYNEQKWSEEILKVKKYRLAKCSKDEENKKTCVDNLTKWFEETVHPKSKQIKERQKMWEKAKNDSSHKNKDEFVKKFWNYRVEKLVCKNIINIDNVIKRSFNLEQKIFAQALFEQIDAGKCPLNPALTDEQRATLDEWLKTSD